MKIRFQADYDFNGEILDGLRRREPGMDIQAGHEAGLEGLPDPLVLEKAAQEGRILVTHDKRTMPGHFADFLCQQESPGVFIIQQSLAIGEAIEAIQMMWIASEAEEWRNLILYLPL